MVIAYIWLTLHPDYLFMMYFLRCQVTVNTTLVLVFGPKVSLCSDQRASGIELNERVSAIELNSRFSAIELKARVSSIGLNSKWSFMELRSCVIHMNERERLLHR
ncbi:hypothetical protein DPMN_187735 [Dreissena polymorpha]|uniref:Uncharacterized protein n=1 Tax=Dreissena polymorpha TaxID=45954 RepID=A0A9D4DR63_DREPO|nr:hypothetical protein DPMN_187735 [Dreissena polymorpha]